MIVKEMILAVQEWGCAKFAMTRRSTAFSCRVDMLELVKDVLQGSRTRANLVLIAGRAYLRHIVFICKLYFDQVCIAQNDPGI